MRIINTTINDEIDFFTDEECVRIRERFIKANKITIGTTNLTTKNEATVVSTKHNTAKLREFIIKKRLLFPNVCDVKKGHIVPSRRDEGEYKLRPISSKDYERRLQLYFYALQSILQVRREFNLKLGDRRNSEPDWIF